MELNTLTANAHISTEISVKWGEMDAFSHLNNTVYIRYIEDGRIDLLEKMGLIDDIKKTSIGPVLASVQCDFLAPVTFPDTVIVLSKATQTGPKKVSFEHKLWSTKNNCLVAQGSSLAVYYNFKSQTSCAIPQAIINKLDAMVSLLS
jgi:acyl-CoA thioester hydrolase